VVEHNISSTAEGKLGFYVYLLVDPRDDTSFYVGKGKGSRCLTHLDADGSGRKAKRIRAIRKANLEPRIEILVHGLKDEKTAFNVEAAVIDLLGLDALTNLVRGQETRTFGRRDLFELLAEYNPLPVKIEVPAILIRINKLYHQGMSDVELYDATRGIWRVGRDIVIHDDKAKTSPIFHKSSTNLSLVIPASRMSDRNVPFANSR
jgi:uncharacterized protein